MPKILIIGLGVTLSGLDIQPGMEIELDESNANSLIEAGLAEGLTAVDENPTDPALDEIYLQTKALDGQYKRDELYEAAKEVGVDIAFDAKKAEIIAAVLAQGFAAALIK